jgi:DNA primase
MIPENDNYEDYERYAEYCLNMVAEITDQETRRILREMAAEWLRLADAIRHSHRFEQRKIG